MARLSGVIGSPSRLSATAAAASRGVPPATANSRRSARMSPPGPARPAPASRPPARRSSRPGGPRRRSASARDRPGPSGARASVSPTARGSAASNCPNATDPPTLCASRPYAGMAARATCSWPGGVGSTGVRGVAANRGTAVFDSGSGVRARPEPASRVAAPSSFSKKTDAIGSCSGAVGVRPGRP